MSVTDLDAEIRRVEQRLAEGRLRIHRDWNELGDAVARKTSWTPVVLGAVGVGLVLMVLRRRPHRDAAAVPLQRSAFQVPHQRWASLLAIGGAIARVVTLPQLATLWRVLRNRRS